MSQDEERFDVTIRIKDSSGVTTEVAHEGCPESKLLGSPIVGSALEMHQHLRQQDIKHLEVTI